MIYALHSGDKKYRYIGKTIKSPESRLKQHYSETNCGSSLPVHRWIRKQPFGQVFFDILYTSEDEEFLFDMERYFIQFAKNTGHKLLNLTNGGEGISGYKMSESQKEKLSAMKKGKPGHPHTEQHKAMMSKRFKGRGLPWANKIVESRGDKFKGEGNPGAKLSKRDVEEILLLWALPEWPCAAAVGEYYGVTKGAVERIFNAFSWSHLDRPDVTGIVGRRRVTGRRARQIVEAAFVARNRMREDGL